MTIYGIGIKEGIMSSQHAPGNTVLEVLEKETREARKGLWVDQQPVPPWEWRKRKSP